MQIFHWNLDIPRFHDDALSHNNFTHGHKLLLADRSDIYHVPDGLVHAGLVMVPDSLCA